MRQKSHAIRGHLPHRCFLTDVTEFSHWTGAASGEREGVDRRDKIPMRAGFSIFGKTGQGVRIHGNRQKIAVVSFRPMTYTSRGQGAGSFAKRVWMLSPRPTDPLAEFTPHGAAQVWPPQRLVRGKLVRRFRSRWPDWGYPGRDAPRTSRGSGSEPKCAAGDDDTQQFVQQQFVQQCVSDGSEGCLCSESDLYHASGFVFENCFVLESGFVLENCASLLAGSAGLAPTEQCLGIPRHEGSSATRISGDGLFDNVNFDDVNFDDVNFDDVNGVAIGFWQKRFENGVAAAAG